MTGHYGGKVRHGLARAVSALGLLQCCFLPHARALTPPVLALAYGVGELASPTPIVTPTPPPAPGGPKTYNFPADGSFVSILVPAGWTATSERSGKLLCAPNDPAVGYSAELAIAGNFSKPEQAKSYLSTTVKETVAVAGLDDAKFHPLKNSTIGSGHPCLVQIVDGKLGSVPTSYMCLCFAPVRGRYVVFIARGQPDKLGATGYEVIVGMADTIRGL